MNRRMWELCLDKAITGFPGGSDGKGCPARQVTWVRPLAWEESLEKGMAAHSSVLAWRIPRTEKPGGPQSRGSGRGRHRILTNTVTLLKVELLSWFPPRHVKIGKGEQKWDESKSR